MNERVSIECRKTKTKVITLTNQKGRRQSSKQSKLEVITRSRYKARENVHGRATIGWKSGTKTVNQSLDEVMQNQSNSLLTFDAQLKTALINKRDFTIYHDDGDVDENVTSKYNFALSA